MGKRELLIISLFVGAGVAAYQLSAPPARPGASGPAWRALLDAVTPGSKRPRASVARTTSGTIELTDAITEARISNIARIVADGADREDIAYRLTVESAANDETAATAAATQAALRQDRVGSVVALRLDAPRGSRITAQLEIHLPSRLALRTDGSAGHGRLEIAGLASVRLESIVGDVRLTSIAGAVTGSHRTGDLIAASLGAVQLALVSSKAQFDDVKSDVTVTARNGRLTLRRARGHVQLDLTNQQTTVDEPAGDLHVLGSGGALQVRAPRAAVTVDVRNMRVDVTVDRAVPIAVLTADAPLHLGLIGLPAIVLDATTSDGGRVRVGDPALVPAGSRSDTQVVHRFGAGAQTIALRNQRGDIVIDAVK